jgi:hypothetical protein
MTFGGLRACAVAGALVGCSTPAVPEASDARSGALPVEIDPLGTSDLPLPEVSTAEVGHVDLGLPPPAPEPKRRDVRRMNIDQLDASIARVTGRQWTDATGRSLFEVYAGNLGKPDYAVNTVEDLSATMLFEKFLGDAARTVCDDVVTKHDAVFFRYARPVDTLAAAPARVKANIQYLVLTFHGRYFEVDAPELETWIWLFDTATARTGDPRRGWRSLCAGLMTHPDFVAY